jgi:hypothetical protein
MARAGPVKDLQCMLRTCFQRYNLHGSFYRFVCDKTYSLVGPELKVCSENERWLDLEGAETRVACEEVRCPMPPRPNNTVVSISSTERLHGTSVIRCALQLYKFKNN